MHLQVAPPTPSSSAILQHRYAHGLRHYREQNTTLDLRGRLAGLASLNSILSASTALPAPPERLCHAASASHIETPVLTDQPASLGHSVIAVRACTRL